MIRNNIQQQNVHGGITATSAALPGLTVEFNINNDGYGDDVTASTDLTVDPSLSLPPVLTACSATTNSLTTTSAFSPTARRSMPVRRLPPSSVSAARGAGTDRG